MLLRISVFACVLFLYISNCLAHEGHDHHHHDSIEDVKFRYSKRANEAVKQGGAEDGHGHHSHGQDHGHVHDHHHGHAHHHQHGHEHHSHDHSHEHHGNDHSHEHHGHDHSHEHHGHDHSHDDHGHGHSHEHHGHDHSHEHHAHDHSHDDHGHDHSHEHHGCDHSHEDHGHDHSYADHGRDHSQEHHGHGGCCSGSRTQGNQANEEIWKYALGSTLLISAAPFFILFFIPLQNNDEQYQPLLKVLLSFASGGLLGDAFLHLIPHAIEYQNHHGSSHHHHHGHSHGHEHHEHVHDLTIGLSVIGGFVLFLVIEKFVRLCNGGHDHHHGHRHGHQPAPSKGKKKDKNSSDEKEDGKTGKSDNDRSKLGSGDTKSKKEKVHCDSNGHNSDIKVSGYLNLVADFTHNFTDGLTIATSYMLGMQVGIVSTITILFHEVPHEIGDFSILIQSGFGKRKAILMQSLTAIGALSGTLVGLMAQGLGDEFINMYILPFTAGGFIYIATVSVIPELLEETKVGRTLIQLLAIFLGVYLMVVISWYE